MCCRCCVHIYWCSMNYTDTIHLYVSCMHLLLFSQLVLYSKASGSNPTPLSESNFMERDLWNSSFSPSLVPHSLGPCLFQCWHVQQVLCVSLLSQFAQKRLSGRTDISQGSGLLLVLHHSLQSMLVVLCSIGPVTHTQKHQNTSGPLALTQGSFILSISLRVPATKLLGKPSEVQISFAKFPKLLQSSPAIAGPHPEPLRSLCWGGHKIHVSLVLSPRLSLETPDEN